LSEKESLNTKPERRNDCRDRHKAERNSLGVLRIFSADVGNRRLRRVLFLIISISLICVWPFPNQSQQHPNELYVPSNNCCYLVVRCVGGLGNLMFQYASLYGLAKTNRLKPIFECENSTLEDVFRNLSIARSNQSSKPLVEVNSDPCCTFKQSLTTLLENRSYHVAGFVQSWKYFSPYMDDIRQQFVFQPEVEHELKRWSNGSELIGIHTRRNDYTQLYYRRFGHFPTEPGFLRMAIGWFRKRFEYDWNVANSPKNDSVMVLQPRSPGVDMCVLSRFPHVIFSSGTFGWWAAFLANGTAAHGKLCRPNSNLCAMITMEDFLLPGWQAVGQSGLPGPPLNITETPESLDKTKIC
uniref:L-Fucosyltransferase n=1 Tax=Soboliphyme baturini TaxID=241478 RepID=A0A183J6B3_9BILA